jgi:hypothetical protein
MNHLDDALAAAELPGMLSADAHRALDREAIRRRPPETPSVMDFLLARLAADEDAYAEDVRRDDAYCYDCYDAASSNYDPVRLLADVAAKKLIVELHEPIVYIERFGLTCGLCLDVDDREHTYQWPCNTIKALISIYADHPDFDPAWGAR